MANVNEILQRTPPAILYHYTTQQGLLGIINGKEIWASHTQYLNDTREFRHAIDLLTEELLEMEKDALRDQRSRNFLAQMRKPLSQGRESVNVCVCSFSEKGDMLSQWRAYGESASGFAIGFSGEHLRKVSEEHGYLVPVLYDEGEQRRFARALLKDVLAELMRRPAEEGEASPVGGNLGAYLNRYAPILKHKSFEEEREWRIITKPLMCSGERFDYRAGASMLIPYFRLPLSQQESLGIREIVIGPTPHPAQSSRSVDGLLMKNGIATWGLLSPDAVTIRCSEVPYRSW